jgi:hypothetical protein
MSTQVSVSNVATARKMFDAFKQGDIPFILNQLDDNCQWNVMGAHLLPYAGMFVGKGTGLFFSKMAEEIEFSSFDVENIYDVSDTDVIATGSFATRHRKTGKTAPSPWAMLMRFQNGKVIFFQDYVDTAQLVAASQP